MSDEILLDFIDVAIELGYARTPPHLPVEWRRSKIFTDLEVSSYGGVREVFGSKRPVERTGTYRGTPTIMRHGWWLLLGELVLDAFVGSPDNRTGIMFLDQQRDNCHIDNLRWVVQKKKGA